MCIDSTTDPTHFDVIDIARVFFLSTMMDCFLLSCNIEPGLLLRSIVSPHMRSLYLQYSHGKLAV